MPVTKALLVEGPDDFHVILNLQGTRELRVIDKSEIRILEGVERLLESLPIQIKASQGGVVGAVLDADTDLAARWSGIRHHLLGAGYPNVPDAPDPNGTILEPPAGTLLPRVGVWLMPNNAANGILEDFLHFLIPAADVLFSVAESTVDGLPDKKFPIVARSKAVVHTWLAWQEEPGRPFGQAITARFLDPNVTEAGTFISWLQRLFSD